MAVGTLDDMLKKTRFILFFALLAFVSYFFYQHFRIPVGIEPQGIGSETMAILALITSIVSFLTALAGLVSKLIDLKKSSKQ